MSFFVLRQCLKDPFVSRLYSLNNCHKPSGFGNQKKSQVMASSTDQQNLLSGNTLLLMSASLIVLSSSLAPASDRDFQRGEKLVKGEPELWV
jgi:hypothetical protein